jgi:ArsR family transcriptional regulator
MDLIKLFKVLSDENRLRIINLLMDHNLCVCELEVMLNLSQSNVSRHLSKIKRINLLESSKDAQWIHYKVSDDFVESNEQLVKYLKRKFSEEKVFQKDLETIKNYKENNLNCQLISDDREMVIKIIR